jgi:hypothetical protein
MYHQLEKVLRHIKFIREMLKDQLHCLKSSFAKNFEFCKDVVDLSTFL